MTDSLIADKRIFKIEISERNKETGKFESNSDVFFIEGYLDEGKDINKLAISGFQENGIDQIYEKEPNPPKQPEPQTTVFKER